MSVASDVITVGKWLVRFAALLPSIKKYWDAVQASDESNTDMTGPQIAAAMDLQRAIARQQAKEELEG